MDKKTLLAAIKAAPRVFAACKLTDHETFYVQVIKADLIHVIKNAPEGIQSFPTYFKASVRAGYLYLD
jgi:hypothetical protein